MYKDCCHIHDILCSITDLKGAELFRLDEGGKEDEAMVLVDMKGREVGIFVKLDLFTCFLFKDWYLSPFNSIILNLLW